MVVDRWLQAETLCDSDANDTERADKAFFWQVFFLKEKLASLSGDDFDILDGNNNPAFKMQASAVSLAEKRVLKNAQNQPVCSLKKKVCWQNQLSCTICCLLISCASSSSGSVRAWHPQKCILQCLNLPSSRCHPYLLSASNSVASRAPWAVLVL